MEIRKAEGMWKKLVITAAMCFMVFQMTGLCVWASPSDVKENAQSVMEQIKQELEEALDSVDEETVKEIFSFLKDKVKEGELTSSEDILKAVEEGEEKFGVKMDEADAKKLVETMEKLENMGFSMEYVIEKADALYDSYGADFVEHMDELVTGAVKNAAASVANSFFQGLKKSVKSFFQNLF